MAKAFVSGVGAVEIQEKTIDITENGTIEILPDTGKVLSKVTAMVKAGEPEYTEGLAYTYDSIGNCAIVSAGSWEGAEELRIPLTQVIDGYGELPVSKIESNGFANKTMLKRVYADGITSTNSDPFFGCTNLEYLSIKGFKGFASFEFSSLTSLKEVILGDVDWVDWGTFGSCSDICRFDFSNCTKAPDMYYESSLGLAAYKQILVPPSLYDEWRNATNWAYYANNIIPWANNSVQWS